MRLKLRNKHTGGIDDFEIEATGFEWLGYTSLREFCEDWEDYEEPKEQYYIKENGTIGTCGAIEDDIPDEMLSEMKSIGNYFETKEEAEKAVEKLKALTRLKDNGFKFTGFEETDRGCLGDFTIYCHIEPDYTRPYDEVEDDLDLLFGGEE